jgi:hypothetical protein
LIELILIEMEWLQLKISIWLLQRKLQALIDLNTSIYINCFWVGIIFFVKNYENITIDSLICLFNKILKLYWLNLNYKNIILFFYKLIWNILLYPISFYN